MFDLLELTSVGFQIQDLRDFSEEVARGASPLQVENNDDTLTWSQRYLPHYFVLPPSSMHRRMSKDLSTLNRKRGQKRAYVAPRGFAKSTLVTTAYVLKCICESTESYILIISDTSSQSQMMLDTIKSELEDNIDINADYPQACGMGRKWTGKRIITKNGIIVEALGTGNKIRGRRYKQNRPSLIIGDDIENDDHIFSPKLREKTKSWFQKALMKCGNKNTNYVVVGTVLHRDALLQNLTRTPGWRSRKFQAIMQWPTNMSYWSRWEQIFSDVTNPRYERDARRFFFKHKRVMEEGAVCLWPEQEDLYTLMCMRVTEGKNSFESEKQGNPVDPGTTEWPQEFFDEGIWVDRWPNDDVLDLKVIAIDPSKGRDAKTGDYSAIVKLGRVKKTGVIYFQCNMERRPAEHIVSDGIEIYRTFPGCHGMAIEINQFQELLAAEFERLSKLQGMMIPIFGIQNNVKKEVRIRRLGPYLRRKLIRFVRDPGTKLMVEQMMDFPNGDHDDGPDAAEMAMRLAIHLDTGGAL